MIEEGQGNLLEQDVDALVNTVNTVGIMGKGVALQFKRAFPANFKAYERACRDHQVRLGQMFVVDLGTFGPRRIIINFPTKGHWRSPSRIPDIERGLEDLLSLLDRYGIRSIAMPALGCGNGGLEWSDVRPLIVRAFASRPDIRLVLFGPGGKPAAADMPDARPAAALTPGRATVVAAVAAYGRASFPGRFDLLEPGTSLLELQKLLYISQECGAPLSLSFSQQHYGPFSNALNHVMVDLEGHHLIGFGDGDDAVLALKPIQASPGAEAAAAEVLEGATDHRDGLERALRVVDGFESAYGMELLASVLFVARRDGLGSDDPNATTEALHAWSARKARLFDAHDVTVAMDRLAQASLVSASVSSPRR